MENSRQYYKSTSYSSSNSNRGSRYEDRGRYVRRNNYSDRGQNENFDEKSDKITIHIETDKVGKLIGKSGSNIRELQDKTNTKIRVSVTEIIQLILHLQLFYLKVASIQVDRSTGIDVTAVIIIGSKEGQDQAKQLIEESLGDSHQNFQTRGEEEYRKQDDEPQIDFNAFDWSNASKKCVSLHKLLK